MNSLLVTDFQPKPFRYPLELVERSRTVTRCRLWLLFAAIRLSLRKYQVQRWLPATAFGSINPDWYAENQALGVLFLGIAVVICPLAIVLLTG